MLTVFAILLAGIGTGRLLYGRRLVFLSPLITAVIWLLLFLLGVEAGSDPAVVGGLTTLGATAFVIFALSVSGSILASWALWRWIRRRPGMRIPASAASPEEERPVPLWEALKGSLTIVAFFVAGCIAGGVLEPDMKSSSVSSWVLYALMFCVGVSLGNDRTLVGRVRQLDRRLALLPAATCLGTLLGADRKSVV